MMKRSLRIAIVALSALGMASAVTRADQPVPEPGGLGATGDPHVIIGSGKPFEEHEISFPSDFSGTPVIGKVLIEEGQSVKKGDILMVEDTTMAQRQLDVLMAGAAVTASIDEATAEITIKADEMALLGKLSQGEMASTEYLNVKLDHDVAVARKQEAEQSIHEKQVEVDRQKEQIAEMTLRSPVDGIVRTISLHVGEVVQNKEHGAVDIYVNNPLLVEVNNLPAAVAGRLKMGDVVQVAFPDSPTVWHDATVDFLDPMVQPDAQFRTVRFKTANPDNQPAGLNMLVKLPDRVLADASVAGAK